MTGPASERRRRARPVAFPAVEDCAQEGPAEGCRRAECRYYIPVDWASVARAADLDDISRAQLVRHGSRCAIQLAGDHHGMAEEAIAQLLDETLHVARVAVWNAMQRVRKAAPPSHDDDERLAGAAVALARRCADCGESIAQRTGHTLRCPPCARKAILRGNRRRRLRRPT